MIEAKTAAELADHIERELAKGQAPGIVLADITGEHLKWIVEALRRLRVLRSTSQG